MEKVERFRWPVSVSRHIDASSQRIWEAISRPGNLNDFHPFCEKNSVVEWPGVGSKDIIHYYSGWVLHREFVNWFEGIGYDLTIGRDDKKNSFVSWRISRDHEENSELSITIYPHALQNIPSAIRWIPHIIYMQPALHSYLESVTKGIEWFITTEIPVRKNQFGSHKWFSNNKI